MSGVFLSYSRLDRELAEQILWSLRALGVDVWWDGDMPGVDWQAEVERQITELTAVMVLWTVNSLNSKSVRDEARLGLNIEKLINVLSGVKQPPFPFDRVNGLPLDGWTGREPHPGWTRLVKTIETHAVRTGNAAAGSICDALARRERALAERLGDVARWREAFEEAQSAETESTEAVEIADAALEQARDQQRRVVEMRPGAFLLRAAQDELDNAAAAKTEADKALRSIRLQRVEAARSLSKANFEIERLWADAPERHVERFSERPQTPEIDPPVGVAVPELTKAKPLRTLLAPPPDPPAREPRALAKDQVAALADEALRARGRLSEPTWIQAVRRESRANDATALRLPGHAHRRSFPGATSGRAAGSSAAPASGQTRDGRVARIGLGIFAALVVVFVAVAIFGSFQPKDVTPNADAAATATSNESTDASRSGDAPAGAAKASAYQWAPSNTSDQNAELDRQWKICSGSNSGLSISACTKMLAQKEYLSAINQATIYSFRSRAYNSLGKYPQALYDRELEIALGTKEPRDYLALAIDYGNVGDFKSEVMYDDRALKLDPNFVDALKDRAAAVQDLANISGNGSTVTPADDPKPASTDNPSA